MTIWEIIARQRLQLADVLDGLGKSEWETPSLCSNWTVRDVVGHLITPFEVGTTKILLRIVMNGFDFNQAIFQIAKELASRPTRELVATLRANAESEWKPPGLGPVAPLADIVMHIQDIYRPLGIEQRVALEPARLILDFMVSRKGRGFVPPSRLVDLRLTPDDLDWSWGSGLEVKGAAGAVLMAIGGRAHALEELSGEGVEVLGHRLRAS